jgi:hypothetical protein
LLSNYLLICFKDFETEDLKTVVEGGWVTMERQGKYFPPISTFFGTLV